MADRIVSFVMSGGDGSMLVKTLKRLAARPAGETPIYLIASSIGVAANVPPATFTYENAGEIASFAGLAGIALDTLWKFVVSRHIISR